MCFLKLHSSKAAVRNDCVEWMENPDHQELRVV